ncbi:MAG: nucleotidyltransferase family protein [Prevotella sp.]|nr:nucleotidyltransferase family protein [Prevotella sp.]
MNRFEFLQELLQVAFGRRDTLSQVPSEKEWYAVLEEAQRQAVAGICLAGIDRLMAQGSSTSEAANPSARLTVAMPFQLKMEWIGQSEQIKQQNVNVNGVLKELASLLNKNSVRYAVVKGQTIASVYSRLMVQGEGLTGDLGLLRQAGDIDFYVEAKDFERTKQLIQEAWGVTYEEIEGHHHVEFEYKDVPLEQHHKLIKLYNKKKEEYWDELMRDAFGVQEIEGVKVSVLTPTLHSLYIFLHLYHHLLELGVGLRQFCDWAVMLHACKADIDHEAIRTYLKVLGMEKAYRACGAILVEKLGLPADDFTYELNDSDRKYGRKVMGVVEYRGNMGHYNLKGGYEGMWHNVEATGIKIAHFMKFMSLAPGFSCRWLKAEMKRKITKKLK